MARLLRGSSTLADVQALGVDMTAFMQEFGIPSDTSLSTRLRDLTELYGFEVEEVRAYVSGLAP